MLNLSLIWELTKRDFTEQYAGSALGMTWAVFNPLINLAIYTIIFGNMMGGRLPDRPECMRTAFMLRQRNSCRGSHSKTLLPVPHRFL